MKQEIKLTIINSQVLRGKLNLSVYRYIEKHFLENTI